MTLPSVERAAVPQADPDDPGPRWLLLYHGTDVPVDRVAPLFTAERIEAVPVSAGLAELASAPAVPSVLLLDDALAAGEADLAGALARLPPQMVVVPASLTVEARVRGSDRVLLALRAGETVESAMRSLRTAFRHSAARLSASRLERELGRARAELRELSGIGMALMTERDPDRLLQTIVEKALQLTGSDAASLYLVEADGDEGAGHLRFRLSRNDSLPDLPFVSFTLPISEASVAGYVALHGRTLVVDDAYRLPADAPYAFNRSFDERFGYRTQSQLVVPMIDHPGRVVGVLQLINRKRDPRARITSEAAAERWVQPYGDRELQLVQALAGQAAVSIENSILYRQIETIFESFVKAAVIAVDQRDPTTSGHSVRVATLTVDLAAALSDARTGPHAGTSFTPAQLRELRYASLLHDFGKVGVREEVLVKARKLPPLLFERVHARFDLIRRTLEADHWRLRAQELERAGASSPVLAVADEEFRRRTAELEEVWKVVDTANQPSILPEKAAEALDGIGALTFRGADGQPQPYLTAEELHYLRIPKGSLNERERLEIESHVEQTYRFLTQIPWTGDLKRVAELAYGHHEKLNGRGYPRGVVADDIPVQTRIMTVVDIFDALTASDRPYKKALPAEKALDILHMEARDGLLDQSLVDLLVGTGHYRRILETDWRDL
ncbi:MAG TPA: HD domain-containing phosphohydrolase [Longimicrobiaceae bacterium]|nr:HD domain-containing phosphohydrolase [Longimicrobiaceae bacterium]